MDHADDLRRLRGLVAGNDPTPGAAVVPIYADRPLFRGTVAPVLQARFEATASGLLVPVGTMRRPQPIDQAKVYLTAEESLDQSIPVDVLNRVLSWHSLEDILPWTAYWMAKLRRPGVRQQDVDVEFATTYLAEPHRQRVLNLVKAGRVLVVPQALLVLAKIALMNCPPRGVPEAHDQRPLVFILLGLTEHLGSEMDEDLESGANQVITGTPGALGREVIANQLANRHRDEASRWATFEECWRQLPAQLAAHPRVVDMSDAYEDATGVPLDDLVTVCAAMWATANNGTPHLAPGYFDALGWSEDKLAAALQLVSATPEQMAQMLSDEGASVGIAWSVQTLQQYPVVRWATGHLTVLDPDLVIDRATGTWPLYDIARELESRGDSSTGQRVRGSYAHLFEHHVTSLVDDVVGTGSLQRAYSEDDLRHAFGRRHKVADVAVDYGTAWIVLDATTAGVQLRTFAGSDDESVEQDIQAIVRKARQLDATINLLRERQEALTGHRFEGGRRFHPVVVVAGAAAGGPIFMTLLREALAAAGVLLGEDVATLEILEVEDLHVAAAVAEAGGPSLVDLLRGKEASALRDMSLKDYVLLDLGLRPGRPRRIQSAWPSWLQTAITHLGGAA
jgi:hypothetical protein